eukprot:755303-Amphidinium_carterae.2
MQYILQKPTIVNKSNNITKQFVASPLNRSADISAADDLHEDSPAPSNTLKGSPTREGYSRNQPSKLMMHSGEGTLQIIKFSHRC